MSKQIKIIQMIVADVMGACRGLSPHLARQVAEELTAKDVIRAHARECRGQ